MRIRLISNQVNITATLRDTPTARALAGVLPFTASVHTWGDEVYFPAPMRAAREGDAQQVVEPGTVGFWVEGASLAIPFGPTPISIGEECRLAARVNILGSLDADPRQLATIRAGDSIRVEQA